MREIKFRAWIPRIKVLEKVDEINWYPDSDTGAPRFDPCSRNMQLRDTDVVIEQFTGLKDKNGKEIYEGDIITYAHGGWNYKASVHWCDAQIHGWIVRERPRCHDGHYGNLNIEPVGSIYHDNGMATIEIIGNIHENPELTSV